MSELTGWCVLAVDDEPDNLGVINLILRFHKASVITAESGHACLEALQTAAPTVLLVDIQMPHMSGFDLLKLLRADDRWAALPIIAITAHAMAGDEERILGAGFDGYISKPISALTLADEIIAIVDGVKVRQGST
jgi:two-component system cell cycle response regulator DivK